MEKYPFIFSNQPYYRWRRHFVFWFCWWVFSGFLYSFSAGILGISYFSRLPVSLLFYKPVFGKLDGSCKAADSNTTPQACQKSQEEIYFSNVKRVCFFTENGLS